MAGISTSLYSFGYIDGEDPASLFQGNDGNFYGITVGGGTGSGCEPLNVPCGTIFKLTPEGTLTTLYDFSNCETPGWILQGTDGNFYGTFPSNSMPGFCWVSGGASC